MIPKPNQLVTHYKGGLYKVLSVAFEEATMVKVVVYQAQHNTNDLGDKPIFTRPLSNWKETVEFDGKKVLRFTPVAYEELQFITGNAGKMREASKIIPNLKQLNIDLPEIQSLDPKEIILAKIDEAKHQGYRNFFVEDTCLFVNSIGYPGPLIKWVLKTIGLKFGSYYKEESARVVCSVGYCDVHGKNHFIEGVVQGKIVEARGEDFGFNPIFQPTGYDQTYAELSLEVKTKINHRAIALAELKKLL